VVDAVEAAVTVARSVPHGHVAAAWAMARSLGLPGLLGPAGPERNLALGLIISRAVHPGSKLSTIAWWADVTLGPDLGIEHATTDDAYTAMDWLQARQELIEKKLARRHLAPEPNPSRMALFDLSNSWLEGPHCPLGHRGYSRDGKKGKVQIEYGLLTDPEGRPVAIPVLEGNAGDPAAFAERSAAAEAKARRQHDEHGRPYLSYQGLLDHLAALARNELGFHGTRATVPVLTDFIGAAIPLTLKK
jgi:hypothetical protein